MKRGRAASSSRLSARPTRQAAAELTPTRPAAGKGGVTTPARTAATASAGGPTPSRVFLDLSRDEGEAPPPEQPALQALLGFSPEGSVAPSWGENRVLATIECVRGRGGGSAWRQPPASPPCHDDARSPCPQPPAVRTSWSRPASP